MMRLRDAVGLCDWLFHFYFDNYCSLGQGNLVVLESVRSLQWCLMNSKVVVDGE